MKKYIIAIAAVTLLLSACDRNMDGQPPQSSVAPSVQNEQVVNPENPPMTPPESEPSVNVEETLPEPAVTMAAINYDALSQYSADQVIWGPGVHKDSIGRSIACVDLQERFGKYGAYFTGPNHDYITLSFDQGYENGYTESILNTLKEKEAKAIFFITGDYLRAEPELIQRMIDEGHIIGNHSNKHLDYAKEDPEKCYNDMLWLHDAMLEQFNYEMRLFRYPAGTFNERSLAMMQQIGYIPVFWSFAYADWNPKEQLSEEAAMVKIKQHLHPGEIMLLHSVGETNSLILDDIIDYIRDQGYTIAPFAEIDQ